MITGSFVTRTFTPAIRTGRAFLRSPDTGGGDRRAIKKINDRRKPTRPGSQGILWDQYFERVFRCLPGFYIYTPRCHHAEFLIEHHNPDLFLFIPQDMAAIA